MALTTEESTLSLQQRAQQHLLLHFTRNGELGTDWSDLLVLERGEGPYVFDTDGTRYFDALSSLFCSQIGYSYGEEMVTAAASQMTKLAFNTNWATAHPPAIELAERLAELAPGELNKVFFTNGGSESVETAWKLARQYHLAEGEPQRTKAIARDRAYHGVTLGALSFTGIDRFKTPFGNAAIDVRHVSWTNQFRPLDGLQGEALTNALLREMQQAIEDEGPETIAVIIAEPVQNAGGCLTPPPGYWQGLRRLADTYGILLIADEVICGFGRLGEWFGSQVFDVEPDMITVAKGITSAYAPMGAVLVSDKVAEPFYAPKATLLHGITFGGHPVAAAIALQNIEIFEREGIVENVRALAPWLGAHLREQLIDLPLVVDVRGAGFFWAFELAGGEKDRRFDDEERERLLRGYLPRRLREAGLIARADDRGDSVLQIAPPLISSREQLEQMTAGVREVLADAGRFMGL